jgi:hypothetical protein
MKRTVVTSLILVAVSVASVLLAQQPQRGPVKKAFNAQSASTIKYYLEGPSEVVEITNTSYEVTGAGIPGRSIDEQLVLRTRTNIKRIVDAIGIEAKTTVEAWPLGTDTKEKPLYGINAIGTDPKLVNSDLVQISRGLEEVDWWSLYKLGSGEHLFDTYVPLVEFSISRDVRTLRYVGLDVPDDVSDARLKAANVAGVLTYASAERVIREALITCDDTKLARLLRSFDDTTRTVTFSDSNIRLAISQNYPLPDKTITITIPVIKDDLDLARIQAPAGIHVTAWKR